MPGLYQLLTNYKISMNLSGIIILAFIASLPGCGSPKEQANQKSLEELEIEQLLNGYYSAMSNRDWDRYAQFFSEKATLTTIWQIDSAGSPVIYSNTISEFLAQTEFGPDSQPVFEEKMIDFAIDVKKNLATAWVKYDAKFGTKENLHEWSGNDLFSFIRFEDQWKIVSIVYESVED